MTKQFDGSPENGAGMNVPLLYYIRHGQTDWNAARKVQGQTDIPLNDTGHQQAANVARALKAVEADIAGFKIYASPLMRVRQTLSYVLKEYGLDEACVTFDDRLREVSFGDKEGWTWPELNAAGVEPRKDPESYFYWRPENGESYADAAARVRDWLKQVDQPSIIVAHGGISRILRGILAGQSPAEFIGLKVPQTKFFKAENGQVEWIRATM